jgi:hypothetical protein
MHAKDLFFVIPTYRLREVRETVQAYDEHFRRNGHTVRMLVFDDSSPANHEKYYSMLQQTTTHNELYYVGPGVHLILLQSLPVGTPPISRGFLSLPL